MVKSTVSVPTGWPNIKTTYEGITRKLSSSGSKEEKLAAIYYWEARLAEDAALIAGGQDPASA